MFMDMPDLYQLISSIMKNLIVQKISGENLFQLQLIQKLMQLIAVPL